MKRTGQQRTTATQRHGESQKAVEFDLSLCRRAAVVNALSFP
jgi:hypothetical protein